MMFEAKFLSDMGTDLSPHAILISGLLEGSFSVPIFRPEALSLRNKI
jgi:hypothetical protein